MTHLHFASIFFSLDLHERPPDLFRSGPPSPLPTIKVCLQPPKSFDFIRSEAVQSRSMISDVRSMISNSISMIFAYESMIYAFRSTTFDEIDGLDLRSMSTATITTALPLRCSTANSTPSFFSLIFSETTPYLHQVC